MQQDPIVPAPPNPANEPQAVTGKNEKAERKRNILSTIAILIAAPLVALMLTSHVFHPYEVDGESMESSLQNRDRLIVWKLPVTWSRLTHKNFLPARGDVIVFTKPGLNEFGSSDTRQLIKRVIALPGERVVVNGGRITVYNQEHPEGFDPDRDQPFSNNIDDGTEGNVDLVVPEDEVFVCGDNRDNSLDSRVFGTVSTSDIIGELIFRIFPVNKFKSYV